MAKELQLYSSQRNEIFCFLGSIHRMMEGEGSFSGEGEVRG
jgi:hypothetical protein